MASVSWSIQMSHNCLDFRKLNFIMVFISSHTTPSTITVLFNTFLIIPCRNLNFDFHLKHCANANVINSRKLVRLMPIRLGHFSNEILCEFLLVCSSPFVFCWMWIRAAHKSPYCEHISFNSFMTGERSYFVTTVYSFVH